MHRLAVVPQGKLGEALGITHNLGAFGPGVTVAVQGHSLDPKAKAPLPKLRRPVPWLHVLEVQEEGTGLGQRGKDGLDLRAKPYLRRLDVTPAEFHADKANDPGGPVHVFGLQVG